MAGAAQSGDSLLPFVIIKKPLDKAARLLAGIKHRVDVYLVEAESTSMTNELSLTNFCILDLNYNMQKPPLGGI
ncbi:MAG: hypothetical protein EZS28_011195 [Streblomastix strix]|uniref:Uncharacterized protein n=1 Tax=Streblomastix strix TaxID=222440 RepID=A0A5J4WED1_9EUKA|nr:MAG: hypothetical protein EZS28_011195 [Streblomastix strix]